MFAKPEHDGHWAVLEGLLDETLGNTGTCASLWGGPPDDGTTVTPARPMSDDVGTEDENDVAG